jgi:hypothetical protein
LVTVILNENTGDETAKEISIATRAKNADLLMFLSLGKTGQM